MPTNIDPEILKQLQDRYYAPRSGSGWDDRYNLAPITDAQGNRYVASFSRNNQGEAFADGSAPTFENYSRWTPEAYNTSGSYGDQFDAQGNYIQPAYNDPDDGLKTSLGLFLASVGGMQFLPGGAFGGAGGGAGGSGAFVGEGATSGVPAWDAAATGAGGAGSTAMGAAGGSGSGAFLGEGVTSGIPAWDKAAAAAAGSGGSGLLKLGASLLGGALGSQGVQKEETQSTHKDPRVDPYFFGDGTNPGLLQYAQQQLQRDMSPANLLMIDSLKSKGMGLLNQPVAGNGFGLFTKGKY